MGYMSTLAMAQATDLDTALSWHFSAGCYPPIPQEMKPYAKRAIEAAVEDEPERLIVLPWWVTWQDKGVAPASVLIGYMHLDAFIDAAHQEE